MCSTISVQLDAVEALAAELAALSAELDAETDLCRWTGRSLTAALDGREGWTAGATATAWGALAAVVAARTAAVGVTLTGAVAAYRAADESMAGGMSADGTAPGPGPATGSG